MPGRGTADTIFAVRQRMKKRGGKQDSIFITVFIIDLEKKRHRYNDRMTRQEEVTRRQSEKEVRIMYTYEGAITRANTNDRITRLDPSGRYAVRLQQGNTTFSP